MNSVNLISKLSRAFTKLSLLTVLTLQIIPLAHSRPNNDNQQPYEIDILTWKKSYKYVLEGNLLLEKAIEQCPSDGQDCHMREQGRVLNLISSLQSTDMETAKSHSKELPHGVKWANFSPDNRFVVYGFESRNVETRHTAVIEDLVERRVVVSLDDPNIDIECIRWMPDSKSVAILESKSNLLKTPLGLIAALAGHGAPVSKYTLRIFTSDKVPSLISITIDRKFEESSACIVLNSSESGKN